jgi:hypothetical protein
MKTTYTTLSVQFQILTEKNVERDKFDTPNAQIYEILFFWLGTGTIVKSVCGGRV